MKEFNKLEKIGTIVHAGFSLPEWRSGGVRQSNILARHLPAKWYVRTFGDDYHFIRGDGSYMLPLIEEVGGKPGNPYIWGCTDIADWFEVIPFHGDSKIHYYSLAGHPQPLPTNTPT